MKATITLLALLGMNAMTACAVQAQDEAEIGTSEAALTGVEPDELYESRLATDIDYEGDCEGAVAGVEPDEIDCEADSEIPGVEPDEIDYEGECEGTVAGVEPDEIDCEAEAEAATVPVTTKDGVTYGPVITVKPKG